ncbi:MAG: carbon-nitrogen hydrolase family protein [Nevskia sp.]|nr:carbon-nitrogen hydrolase family protein [Nevskia sp.]
MNTDAAPPLAAAIQLSSLADRDENLVAALYLLREAADAGVVLAALPENFAFMGAKERDKLAIAEADGHGPIQDFVAAAARGLGLWIVAGTVPLAVPGDPGKVYAACLVYDDRGQRVARYDKIHLFDVEVPPGGGEAGAAPERYRESATIAGGEPKAVVVDTPVGRLGLSVCYDLRFPELYRALSAQGAEVLCVPAAFTARTGHAHWEVLLRARAIENQCFVIAPAQYGSHAAGRATHGHSLIVDPWGEILAQQEAGDGVVAAPLARERLEQVRGSFPALQHRRM